MIVWRSNSRNVEDGSGTRLERLVEAVCAEAQDSPSEYSGYVKSALAATRGWEYITRHC
jgi:hypothetical protein